MSEPTCVNLQERFGRRYRIGWEADGATKGQWPQEDWPWLMELRCRYGIVHPYGGDILTAVVTDHPGVAGMLSRLPCVRQTKGDLTELRAYFHVDDAAAVFAVLQPYRRRQVSEAERERLAAMGSRALERHRALANVESGQTPLERAPGSQDGESGTGA